MNDFDMKLNLEMLVKESERWGWGGMGRGCIKGLAYMRINRDMV